MQIPRVPSDGTWHLIFVNSRPYRVWTGASTYRDADLILGGKPEFFLTIASPLVEKLDGEEKDQAALGIRLMYGLAVEAFFALVFAVLQAPACPAAWMLLYRREDLKELIRKFEAGEELPSKILPPEPRSWGSLAEMLGPHSGDHKEEWHITATRFGSLWKEIAADFCADDAAHEFHGLKHGLRVRAGSPFLAVGGVQIQGDEHGSSFPLAALSGSDIVLRIGARTWSARTLFARLKLITASICNLLEILRLLHGAGEIDRAVFDLPDAEEFAALKRDAGPLAGLSLGRTWDSGRSALKLRYEDAIEEYRLGSGTLYFGQRAE